MTIWVELLVDQLDYRPTTDNFGGVLAGSTSPENDYQQEPAVHQRETSQNTKIYQQTFGAVLLVVRDRGVTTSNTTSKTRGEPPPESCKKARYQPLAAPLKRLLSLRRANLPANYQQESSDGTATKSRRLPARLGTNHRLKAAKSPASRWLAFRLPRISQRAARSSENPAFRAGDSAPQIGWYRRPCDELPARGAGRLAAMDPLRGVVEASSDVDRAQLPDKPSDGRVTNTLSEAPFEALSGGDTILVHSDKEE